MNSSRFQRVLWNADRFGFSPRKLKSRVTRREGHAIVSNSLPKAGTHLLERALCLTPQLYRAPIRTLHWRTLKGDLADTVDRLKPNQLLVAHLEYTEDRAAALSRGRLRTLFMVRDPRDIVVSQSHFIPSRTHHAHHALFAEVADPNERMRLVISGSQTDGYPSLRQRLEEYAGWLTTDCLIVRYEDLIGPSGGGDHHRQTETLRGIYEFVGLEFSTSEIEGLTSAIFSGASPTFRRGTTQQWRKQFDDQTNERFEITVGDLAALFGYPGDKAGSHSDGGSSGHR